MFLDSSLNKVQNSMKIIIFNIDDLLFEFNLAQEAAIHCLGHCYSHNSLLFYWHR